MLGSKTIKLWPFASRSAQTVSHQKIEDTPAGSLSLAQAKVGSDVTLRRIVGGQTVTRRLTEMGLTVGVKLSVLQAQGGPMLIGVRGTRLALGRSVAQKIIVSPSTSLEQ